MVTILSGMHSRSTTEAFPAHPAQEFLTCTSDVDIHRGGLGHWRNKRDVRKETSSRRGCDPCHDPGTFPFAVPLCATLTDTNINIGCHRYQLVEGADGTSCVNELVFDVSGDMLVKAISEID
jgi:hypothetical protein